MRKPRPLLVVPFGALLLASCVRVQAQPYPTPEARASTHIRGVVLAGDGAGRRVEFDDVNAVEWTDSTLIITGRRKAASGGSASVPSTETVSFPLAAVTAVLVRRVDVNRTSLLIAGIGLGSIIIATVLVNSQDESAVLAGSRR